MRLQGLHTRRTANPAKTRPSRGHAARGSSFLRLPGLIHSPVDAVRLFQASFAVGQDAIRQRQPDCVLERIADGWRTDTNPKRQRGRRVQGRTRYIMSAPARVALAGAGIFVSSTRCPPETGQWKTKPNGGRDRLALGPPESVPKSWSAAVGLPAVRIVTRTPTAFTSPNREVLGFARWLSPVPRGRVPGPTRSSASTSQKTTSTSTSAPPTRSGGSPTRPPASPSCATGSGPTTPGGSSSNPPALTRRRRSAPCWPKDSPPSSSMPGRCATSPGP